LKLPTADTFSQTRHLLDDLRLHTVCESAKCPNPLGMLEQRHRHFHDRRRPLHPRLRILRGHHGQAAGARSGRAAACGRSHPPPEPQTRSSSPPWPGTIWPDGGADHFRQTIEAVRAANPGIVIEILVPDFLDQDAAIDAVLAANPHIYNHNLETVRRLTPTVRSRPPTTVRSVCCAK